MHGHALIRKLITQIRELRERINNCTCGGVSGLTERDCTTRLRLFETKAVDRSGLSGVFTSQKIVESC